MNPDLPSAPIDSADPLPMAIDMTPQELIERNEEIRQKDYELSMANLGSYTLGGDEIYKPKGKDLKEVCRVASHKELVSILDGKADFSTTSEQLYSPALIGLGLKEMNLHTESFDQEATNFLGILGDSMVTLNRPLTKGTYVEGVNGTYYSAGVAWREGSAKTLCVIHSHPSRTIWKEREREKNNPLPPPEKLQLDAHVPSIQDFLSILVQRDEEDAVNENSMIVAGPKIALMIYRTNQSPEKTQEVKGQQTAAIVYNQLMSLVMDKDDPSKGMDMVALFKILKEYKLGMHIMPLTDSSNLLLWDKMYPRPKTLH